MIGYLYGLPESAIMSKKHVFASGFFAMSSLFSMFSVQEKTTAVDDLVREVTNVISAVEVAEDYSPKGLGEHYRVTGEIRHIIREGETIYTIARDMKREAMWIKPQQIIEWNDLTPPQYYLKPGTELTLYNLEWESQLVEASWYGPGFHGKLMANSQVFDENSLVAAHMYLPLGMKVRVTNLENGVSLEVPITDRGNFEKYQRGIDLSKQAAKVLGYYGAGTANVLIEPLQSF